MFIINTLEYYAKFQDRVVKVDAIYIIYVLLSLFLYHLVPELIIKSMFVLYSPVLIDIYLLHSYLYFYKFKKAVSIHFFFSRDFVIPQNYFNDYEHLNEYLEYFYQVIN